MIAWRAARRRLVVALALQIGTNYANDYSDGMRGTDDGPRRAGAAGRLGPGAPGGGEAGRARLASASPRVAGLALAAATSAGGCSLVGAACVRRRLALHRRPQALRLLRVRRAVRVRVLRPGRHGRLDATCRLERITGLSVGCGGRRSALLATALLVVNNLRDIPTDTAVRQADAGRAPRRPPHPRPLRRAASSVAFVVRAARRRRSAAGRRRVARPRRHRRRPARRSSPVLAGATGPGAHPRARSPPAGCSSSSASLLAAGLWLISRLTGRVCTGLVPRAGARRSERRAAAARGAGRRGSGRAARGGRRGRRRRRPRASALAPMAVGQALGRARRTWRRRRRRRPAPAWRARARRSHSGLLGAGAGQPQARRQAGDGVRRRSAASTARSAGAPANSGCASHSSRKASTPIVARGGRPAPRPAPGGSARSSGSSMPGGGADQHQAARPASGRASATCRHEPGTHRVADVGARPAGVGDERGRRRRRSAATSAEPPWPGSVDAARPRGRRRGRRRPGPQQAGRSG